MKETGIMHKIKIKLNGTQREFWANTSETLLEALRERVGVKSPKCGCNQGDCGTCTVLLNGKSIRSCLVLAIEADGQVIETVEGIGQGLHRELLEKFVKKNTFQCGYCAPGMASTCVDLLTQNPKPNRGEIQEAIAGNLCRCTGYEPIIEAIEEYVAGKKQQSKKQRGGKNVKRA